MDSVISPWGAVLMLETTTDDTGLAPKIAALSTEEALLFLRTELAERRLHSVVRQLNSDALSRDPSRRKTALAALAKIGFSDNV